MAKIINIPPMNTVQAPGSAAWQILLGLRYISDVVPGTATLSPGQSLDVLSFEVPEGRVALILDARGTANGDVDLALQVDGTDHSIGRNSHMHPDVQLSPVEPVPVMPGKTFKIVATSRSVSHNVNVKAFVYLNIQSV